MIKDMIYNIENNISFAALIFVMRKGEKCSDKICFNNNKFYHYFFHIEKDMGYEKITKEEFIKILNNIFDIIEYNRGDIFKKTGYYIDKEELQEADLKKRNYNLRVLGVVS